MGEWIFHSKYILLHEWIMDKFNWEFYVFKWGKLLKGLPIGLNNKDHLMLLHLFLSLLNSFRVESLCFHFLLPTCHIVSFTAVFHFANTMLRFYTGEVCSIVGFIVFSIVFWNHRFLAVWNNTVTDAIVCDVIVYAIIHIFIFCSVA